MIWGKQHSHIWIEFGITGRTEVETMIHILFDILMSALKNYDSEEFAYHPIGNEQSQPFPLKIG